MGTRGRKSVAEIEGPSAVSVVRRPDAPLDLTPDEADEWVKIVNAMPGDWFTPETEGLLAQHCRHIVAARRVAQLIDNEMAHTELDVRLLDKLLAAQARETSCLKATSSAMRISQQSSYNAQSASTQKNKRAITRPWES